MWHPEELVACWCAGDLAAHDCAITGNKHLLDIELHIRNGLGEVAHHFHRLVPPPALSRQDSPAGLVIGRKELLVHGFHCVARDRLIEQAVPRRNQRAGLCLS